MPEVTMTVNGEAVHGVVEGNTLLVEFLRGYLRLTGTHLGCDTAQCGACVVHLDGEAVKACVVLALQCEGASVTTIEGLADADGLDGLHPMQAAFRKHHGLQCGFCTSGMVMMGVDIARRLGRPEPATIREELKGNLCRCTGYQNIVSAISAGAAAMADDKDRPRA